MTADEARDAKITSAGVAKLLGISHDTVTRIPRDRLDYWTTPGGHRRYRRVDVERYAHEFMGLDITHARE